MLGGDCQGTEWVVKMCREFRTLESAEISIERDAKRIKTENNQTKS